METKGAIAGGTLLAGGGAGGGYAAYHYLGSSDSGEQETGKGDTESEPQTETQGGQKVEDYLEKGKSDGDTGRPISKLSNDQEDWWKKGFNNYFLEISDAEEIEGAGSKADRDNGDLSKEGNFKTGCQKLLNKRKPSLNEDDEDVKKAKKWCVTYRTVKETLGSDQSKGLEDDSNSSWDNKFEEAVKEEGIKSLVEKLKDTFTSERDSTKKKKKAIHKWCSMALDASENYSLKSKMYTICVFKAT